MLVHIISTEDRDKGKDYISELRGAYCRDKQAKANPVQYIECCGVDKQRMLGKWAWLRMEMKGGRRPENLMKRK